MFVLAVQLHKRGRLIFERRRGDEHVVDEGAAAALRRDLAPDDQLARLRRRGCGRGIEYRLDGGLRLAGANQIGGRPSAHQQPDGLHQH